MNNPNNSREKLYTRLKDDGYDLVDFDTFSKKLDEESSRKSLYDQMTSAGYDLGGYDEYTRKIVGSPFKQNNSVAPTPSEKPEEEKAMISAPSASTDEEYITGFGQGVKQGTQQLAAGVKYAGGEALDLVTKTAKDNASALAALDKMQAEGKDVAQETKIDAKSVLLPLIGHSAPAIDMVARVFGKKNPIAKANAEVANDKIIRKALEETDGDVEAARALLEQRANEQTTADEWRDEAAQVMNEAKPTKGAGAWVGNMIPQMVGTAAGLGLSAITKSPLPAQILGLGQMGALTASTAGASMKEARDAGATNGEVWATGLADAAIEFATEAIPFKGYLSPLVKQMKSKTGKAIADVIVDKKSPARKELQNLLDKANAQLGGKLFTTENAAKYLDDVLKEGASEFTAEALQAITPMLYAEPENYPTLWEVFSNGIEGLKGGIFMGSVLGGVSNAATNKAQRDRRKEQGFVNVAEVKVSEDSDETTIAEVIDYDDHADRASILINGEIMPLENASKNVVNQEVFTFEEFDRGQVDMEHAESYDRGRNLATPQEKNDALNDLEAQEANIRQRYSLDPDADVYEFMGGDPIAYAMNETDTELRSEILDLVNAKAVYDGMTDGINERIATTIEESDRLIDSHVNKDDNLIHAAILKGVDDNSDRKVYIISGAFARNEDGTIDTTDLAEGASMIVMDATSGKREFIDPRNLKDIAEGINPAVAKQRAAETITNEIATKEEAEIAGTLAFVPNDIYTIADENGVEHTATIVADTQDGNVQVIIDNAQEPMLMPKEKVQQMADAYNIGRANAKIAEKKAQSTVAQSSSEVKPTIPMDEQGKPIYEQAPVEATWAELLSLNDGNAEEAIDTAKIMRDNAKKALEKANKAASAKGDTVEAIQQAKAERKALIDAAQAKYDYWDNVANYQASQPQEVAEPTTAEEQTPIVENASFDENINEVEQVYNEESNERSTEDSDVPASVPAEDGIADGDQASVEMVQGAGTDNTLGDRGSIEAGQGSNESNVGEGVADVPSADVFRAEEVDVTTPQLSAKEEMRRKPLRARAKMWEAKVGVPVHLIETFEEVPTEDARKAILDGKVVTAWVTDGEVYLYMPYLRNRTEVDKTYIHEVVAHVGMKRLLGKEGYRQFCMRVYNEVMTEADRKFYDAYPNVKDHAQAADEYIAHLSEDTDMESSVWQKVVRIFRDALRVLGIETALTNKDIQDMLRDSYRNLAEQNVSISESEGTQLRSVYHGSGSDFSKFDHTFMGTGEGHQAFGWGTYVTDVEGIGKQYAKMTSKPRLTFKGEFVDSEELNNPWRIIKDLYDNNHGKLRGMRNDAERIANMVEPDNAEMKELWGNVVRTLSEVRSGDLKITPARYLYSVEIPDNDGTNYLEYGKPLSKTQLNRIKRALYNRLIADTYKGAEQELKEEIEDVFAVEKELDGRDIYGDIATYLGGDKAASEFLNENGYVGISYPADSGNAGKARNYVIFNESDLEIKDSTRFRVKEKAPETVSVQDEHLQTVISSADGTKILKNIDSAIEEYKNDTQTKEKTFLGRVAKAIGAKKQGSGSQYATFEAKNGKVFTIRLADHNAKVSTFDIHNEKDGISIIITAKSNEGIQNDGDAHIVEYFYDSIKLRKADGKPLVEILKSIKQTLYSGEYKDTTGLAEREEVNIRDGVRFRVVEPAPTFYSNAERAAENVKQEKATPEQWLKMIEKNGGLKAGEDKWLGLSDWLKSSDKKTLTKQEVLDFIKENQIQIEEVVYGDIEDNPKFKELEKEYQSYYAETYDSDVAFQRMVDKYGEEFDVAFNGSGMNLYPRNEYGSEDAQKYLGVNEINSTRRQYTTDGLDNKREIALTVPTIESWNESDEIHFGDAGNGRAIAWVRFGETTDADGNRVLVIDEVQSKRHQEGRERGYRPSNIEQYLKDNGVEVIETGEFYEFHKNGELDKRFSKGLLHNDINRAKVLYVGGYINSNVPEAPFEKNWAELAMKRMLRYAAENDFDKVAWTTGEQQAERYSLGAVMQGLKAYKTSPNTYYVIPYNNGAIGEFVKEYTEKELAETFGKEIAVNIITNAENATEENPYEMTGDDLRIGGSGMKAFYDQMIPSFMNKYGKKWGVKVGEVTMPSLEENNTMHSIDVTDAMRESVMQGQPMFRISGYDRQFDALQSEYDALDKNDEKALNEWREKKKGVTLSYMKATADDLNYPIKDFRVIASEEDMRNFYEEVVKFFNEEMDYKKFAQMIMKPAAFYLKDMEIIGCHTDQFPNVERKAYVALFHEQTHCVNGRLFSDEQLANIWDEAVQNAKKEKTERIARNYGDNPSNNGDEYLAYTAQRYAHHNIREDFESYIKGEDGVSLDTFMRSANKSLPLRNQALIEILKYYRNGYNKRRHSRNVEESHNGLRSGNGENQRDIRAERGGIRGGVLDSLLNDVAQRGLREMVGEDAYNAFLMRAVRDLDESTRRAIMENGMRNGLNFHDAAEEYLASLAEQDNVDEAYLSKVNALVKGMLQNAGIEVGDISNNELRYMLWRSHLQYDGIFSLAEDVVMRSRLGVGNYTQEADTSFRVTEREQIIEDAKADGTYLKAPNGKDTNLTPDQWVTVRTDAFKKWFGDWENDPANASQIVDANGEPKVVWHGGNFAMGDFTPNGAMHFGTFDAAVTRLNDKLYGGEVRVEQNADGEFLWEYEDFDDEEFNLRGDKSFASKEDAYREAFSKLNYLINPYFLNIRNIERTGDAVTDWADVVEASKEDGYDGIVYLNDYEDNGSDSYIAFEPNQIKSAEGNTTFDANNDDIRFRVAPSTPSTTIVNGEAKGVRESFDDMVKRASYQMKEAGYDRYQSIKEFMRMASKAHGVNLKNDDVKEIASYENPYIALLNKSSINEKEVEAWETKYYIPIIDAIHRIYKDGKGKIAQLQQYFGSESMDDILNNYLQGKHGLERNRDMAVKASLEKMAEETMLSREMAEKYLEKIAELESLGEMTPAEAELQRRRINDQINTKKYTKEQVKYQTEVWEQRKKAIKEDKTLDTWRKKQEALDKAAITEFGVDLAERDYSGLGEVFPNKGGKLQESIEAAYKAVVAFEEAFDTADLWKAIKAANDATLEKAFMSSIINRETYNNIRNMYDYYIPLRGFEADTTEDVYGYLNNEPKAFSMPVKRANGRASKAEFAIPHILQMAHSAILQGNNNLAKLTMANFAQHYPSDLVKQSNMWIEYDETSKTWVAKYPDIPKDASVEDVSRIVDDFNANMEELAKDNPKKYRKVKGKMDVPYIVPKDKVHYHQIPYKRNGVDYILTVSGSPRLAFVMNGEIDKAPSVMGEVGEKVEGITRFLSGMYTQYNPDFMVSNFFRDASFVLSTVPVREDAKYAANYYKNYFLNNPLVMTRLFNKYEAGTLNRDNYIEAAFEDFLKHGGETGYAILRDVEETKKKVKKDIHYGLWNKAKALIDRLGIVGRGVESSARFAAYLTSREAGRSIARSVYDAKEVSVNFNRKGAGAVFNNLADQNFWGKMVGNTAGVFKITHAFWNAGIQGLAGVSKLIKYNPIKGGMVWTSSALMLGAIVASLYDDDDEYYNLTETVRRQNIMIRMGDDYVSIPLAIELRALYGIGEMMVSLSRGKEDLTQKDVAYKIAEQILQAFPINVLEGNGGFDALMPTAYAMVQELMVNEDWQGIPIYREDKYAGEEYKPEWRMVNNYTDERLVAASKFLSKAAGGDYGKRGRFEIPILGNVAEINPAVVQHIMEGMFGGPVTFANKVLAQYDVLVGDKEFEWRNVPFLNRLVKDGGGKAQERMLNREYRNNEERYEQMHSQEVDYQKFIKDASNSEEERAEYQRKLDELRASEEYKMLNRFHQQSLEIDKMYKEYKDQGILDEQMPTILERKEIANAPLR